MVFKAISSRKGSHHHTSASAQVECSTEMDMGSDVDTRLREEFERLAEANNQIMHDIGDSTPDLQLPAAEDLSQEMTALRRENAQLRARLKEMENLAHSMSPAQDWQERQREYETLLDEKTEAIRTLHLRIQELQDMVAQPEPEVESQAIDRDALLNQNDDLRKLKRELEDHRLQLEEDETSLMEQMRQMEMTMARERADMARQKSEITRLNTELSREIELASRDGALRDRLAGLQRRHQDVVKGRCPNTPSSIPGFQAAAAPAPVKMDDPTPSQNGNIFKRFFGGTK